MSKIKTSIGGQALIEGIMMRGPVKTAMAVRGPGGDIVLEENPTKGANRPKICRLPVIRGVFGMIDSLTVGYKCLMRSAEISGMDEEENEKAAAKRAKKNEQRAAKGKPPLPEGPTLSDKLFNTLLMPLATVLAVALAFGLFYWLPMQLWNVAIVPNGTHSYFCPRLLRGRAAHSDLRGLHLGDLADEGHPPHLPCTTARSTRPSSATRRAFR